MEGPLGGSPRRFPSLWPASLASPRSFEGLWPTCMNRCPVSLVALRIKQSVVKLFFQSFSQYLFLLPCLHYVTLYPNVALTSKMRAYCRCMCLLSCCTFLCTLFFRKVRLRNVVVFCVRRCVSSRDFFKAFCIYFCMAWFLRSRPGGCRLPCTPMWYDAPCVVEEIKPHTLLS